jgi:acyl-coenzyme A synthetase/AMP-(fatty) acid ligase
MSTTLPLLASRDLAQPLAWREGQPISGAQFLAEAAALAEHLPARGQAVNLCQDRYHFALGIAAAALRGHVSLLPPNAMAATLQQLPAGDGAAYAMVDDDQAVDLPGIDLRARSVASSRLHTVPATDSQRVAVPMIDGGRVAVCLLTSGSTGAPQPHAKSWRALTVNIGSEAERLAEMTAQPSLQGMNIVATVPAQHSYGFESSVMLSLLGGAAFDAGRPFYPADVAQALQRLPRPRALVTTPFHLKTLLLSGVDLPPVDLLLCATAPLTPQLAALAEQTMSGPLIEIYGCTEAGQLATRRTTEGQTWTTLGEVHITQRHDDTFVAHGGHVFEPTPLADILALHNEREFGLLGRANDLIHVAGKRSSLAHLNFHLNRIDGVDDGAFWLPDEVPGTVVRPLAFVVAPTLTAAQITQLLRAHLEPAFVPRRVVHVAALPREATGKLTLRALREFALTTLAALADGAAPAMLHVPHDHPSFAGHFPGQPVLPGVVLLSMVMEALRSRLGTPAQIDQAKFLAPVLPGDTLALRVSAQANSLRFELMRGDTAVARGQLSPVPSAT